MKAAPADKDAELASETGKLFHAAIVKGVVLDAKSALDNKRYRAAAILTYAGIDTMASLVRDGKNDKVVRYDFINWAEKYLDFKDKAGPTGLELYGARCGLLHASMAESDVSKKDAAVRLIGYVDQADKPVLADPNVKELVILSTRHLVGIFAEGTLKCWQDIKSDKTLLPLVRDRLQKLFAEFGVNESHSGG